MALSAVIGIGSTAVGGVVGDNPHPWSATVLGAGDYLTSENLREGDPGEFGGLGELAIDFWFKTSSTSAVGLPDNIMKGPNTASGNAQWYLNLNSGGTVAFALRDIGDAGYTTVTSSVALTVDVFYYIAAVYDGSNMIIYINGASAGSAARTGSILSPNGTTPWIVGDAGGVVTSFFYDELALYRHKLTPARVLAHFTAGTQRGRNTETAGPRISAVLDTISSQAPRSLQAGSRNVVETYYNGESVLSKIEQAEAAENVDALFFCARDGTLTFLAADHRSAAPYNTVGATFGDAGGAELPYESLDLDYSDSFIVNDWTVTRTVGRKTTTNIGNAQTASDATSISKYFKRPRAVSDIPVTTDTDALAIANALLPKYKDPMVKITSITVRTFDANLAEAIFRRDLGDKIRILYTPLGGGARIDQSSWIQKIEVDGTPSEPWRIRLGVSPL